jgi:uncharacterized membrane protein
MEYVVKPPEHTCPLCGQALVAQEDAPDRGEAWAHRVSAVIASWPFVAALAAVILAWLVVNLAWRPFAPHSAVLINGLAVGLAVLSALYGPIIIYVQRRQEKRSQERSRAMLDLLLERGSPPPHRPGG